MSIRVLNELEMDEVAGGWGDLATRYRTYIVEAFVAATVEAVIGGITNAARWVVKSAPGGADETTWTNVGHAGMGA